MKSVRLPFLLLGWAVFQFQAAAQPVLSAHRGSSLVAPENTLATFRAVLTMPIRYIEIDVRTTKDGQLVILHDGKLDRTTNGSGPVENQTLAEVKQLSAGKGFGEKFKDERIPTLKEVGQLLRNWNQTSARKVSLYVDCKAVQPQPLVDELAELGLLADAVFYGSDGFLLSLKQVFPRAKVMPSLRSADELPAKIQQLQPYAFDVRWTSLTAELVGQIHAHGIRVFSDALGFFETPEHYRKAAQMGVDVIQTDYVERVSQAVRN
ncbi:glycerophosphoryl diester phosphodiesterase [Larkinella arboricola]|uniref:Glycerophosphoryl diester phosphodiesterase n=1 Tax=Larkinella arboricola TaxID=643671 RepID=A0A327X095_LARAB|nr:glycerophosphodiester phosphodiesterase family protein [Larkinella arboricola]RAJ99747.1 glycerophosphoryl diester phosphodiesterase [Larkinella arboricola]